MPDIIYSYVAHVPGREQYSMICLIHDFFVELGLDLYFEYYIRDKEKTTVVIT